MRIDCGTMKKLAIMTLWMLVFCGSGRAAENKPLHVLFIAVDDLRPELGCYGADHIHSPHIDRLAAEGIVFNKSFCNVPVCGASRASLLTGVRPTRTRFVEFHTWADKDLPGHLSLPRYLKNNGYTTISLGKVYHHRTDDLGGWSEEPWHASGDWITRGYMNPKTKDLMVEVKRGNNTMLNGPAWEASDADEAEYEDGKVARRALKELRRLSKEDKPFFLAVGFKKPHLPFTAPQKYYDLYDHDSIELADNPYRPKDAPDAAIHNSGELRGQYSQVPNQTPLPDEYSRWLRHGYFACVSFIDAQIGYLLEELDTLGIRDQTMIVLWGDHGWNLGEHTMWCKHCNFQTSLRTPLIFSVPGYSQNAKSDALVEFVDIYPTIAELCGQDVPDHCEGTSLVPLLKKPNRPWKEAIYSIWHTGETIRTQQYQYTEWRRSDNGAVYARMLYDHDIDPDENKNISQMPENQQLTEKLSEKLISGRSRIPSKSEKTE